MLAVRLDAVSLQGMSEPLLSRAVVTASVAAVFASASFLLLLLEALKAAPLSLPSVGVSACLASSCPRSDSCTYLLHQGESLRVVIIHIFHSF